MRSQRSSLEITECRAGVAVGKNCQDTAGVARQPNVVVLLQAGLRLEAPGRKIRVVFSMDGGGKEFNGEADFE